MTRLRVGLLAALLLSVNCASLPLKQTAVVNLNASEIALEAAHAAERSLCSPTADVTKAIQHCDGAQAVSLGLTDERHKTLAGIFSHAFDVEDKATIALKAWRAGDPAPTTIAEYQRILSELLVLVLQVVPKTTVAAKTQEAYTAANRTALALGGK